MARILLATLGSHGDLHPFLAIGLALKEQGHDPIVATHAEFGHAVAAVGLEFHPIRPSHAEVLEASGTDMAGLVRRAEEDPWFLLRDVYLPFTPRIFEDISSIAAGVDLIVTHNWVFGAIIAAEALDIPLVRVALSPLFLQSALRPSSTGGVPYLHGGGVLRTRWNAWLRDIARRQLGAKMAPAYDFRRSLGLPDNDYDFVFDFGRDDPARLILAIYSSEFAAKQPDHPAKAKLTGFPHFDGDPAEMPAGLDLFLSDGPAPIVFTLGSFVVNGAEDFYRNGLAACRALGLRSVLIVGPAEAEKMRGFAGTDTFICAYAPHAFVFPRAAAIVHHGGIGTTGQAMRSGKPQLVVPVLGDQPDNSRRLVELGVARRLMVARKLLPDRASIRRLKRELAFLIEDAGYATAGAKIAARLAHERGAAEAARQIAAILPVEDSRFMKIRQRRIAA
jgi:UDP:flavonoid glycosyltransferase YjiC (YdhE family)